MTQYIIGYCGGLPASSQEHGEAGRAKWMQWVQSLGAAAINPGTPLMNSKIVGADGVSDAEGAVAWTGYTIVEAESMDAALVMAKACPYIDQGGSVLVAEQMQMPGQ